MLSKLNLAAFGEKDVLSNFYCLFGEIENTHAQNITEWILTSNLSAPEETPDVLNLIVCSQGGDLSAAWAIIDMMRGSHIPVRTIAVGQIASAGLLIFMSGQKGHRVIAENTSIMSHQYGWGSIGKHHELVAVTKEYTNVQNRLIQHIQKCTGLDKEQINKELMPPSDVWLTPKEAIKLGLGDTVSNLK